MDFPRRTLLAWLASLPFIRLNAQDQPSSNSPPSRPRSSQPVTGLTYRSPYQSIENAAAAMKAGDPVSVRVLVEALFQFPGEQARMPPAMAAVAKQRLVDGQIAYLNGRSSGVVDGAVADAMNSLATAFDAPDYARVSPQQVRFLRSRLSISMPVFMGSVPSAQIDQPNPPMSPLQAMFLMSGLIDQKEVNPDYQAPPEEWDRDYYPRLLEQARAADELRRRIAAGEAKYELRATLSPRIAGRDLRMIVLQRTRQMSASDGMKLFNETLKRLGVS